MSSASHGFAGPYRLLNIINTGQTSQVWQAGYFNDVEREFERIFDRHADVMLEAFRSGQEPPVHARAGLRALRLAWAIVESFETGRRVSAAP